MTDSNRVHEGLTYDYLAHGLGVIVLFAIIGAIFHYVLILLGFILGISMMALGAGVEVDPKNKKIRRYFSIFGMTWGKWMDVSKMLKARLKYQSASGSSESTTSLLAMPSFKSKGGPSAARAYVFSFIDDMETEKEFNQFVDMKPARKTAELVEKKLNIPVQSDLKIMKKALGSKSRRR